MTVSGQLHAEALARQALKPTRLPLAVPLPPLRWPPSSGMSRVYNFSPTFRAEKSLTRKHLSEFWMVEAEMVTLDRGLPLILDTVEGVYKHALEAVLTQCSDDVKFIHETLALPETKVGTNQPIAGFQEEELYCVLVSS